MLQAINQTLACLANFRCRFATKERGSVTRSNAHTSGRVSFTAAHLLACRFQEWGLSKSLACQMRLVG